MENKGKVDSTEDINSLSYEQAFAELEKIVRSLENEQFALDDTMAQFERGQLLVKRCSDLLEKADLRLQVLGEGSLTLDGDEEV